MVMEDILLVKIDWPTQEIVVGRYDIFNISTWS